MTRAHLFISVALACLGACGGRTDGLLPVIEVDAGAGGEGGGMPTLRADKLDVLFVVDNTITATFAQPVLADTIPHLLDRLTNPPCVNGFGEVVSEPPAGAPCPVGTREFAPLTDIHIGVTTTSIGGHGADSCSPASGAYHPMQEDNAHLLTRSPSGAVVPTYQGLGFLAWDPGQKQVPPGLEDPAELSLNLRALVRGAGGKGCGFEAPLEAMYRFLVDPDPWSFIQLQDQSAVLVGTDDTILAQRAAFLRPDSAVVVIVLTDENDCSTRDGGQYYYSNQAADSGQPFHLPRPRAVCATSPEDPCCASCGQVDPPGCGPDPSCDGPPLDAESDPVNLRCFEQKRRFGIDFLWPVDRYVTGLTAAKVPDRAGELVANPLFAGGRAPSLVTFAAIVGVPWQDIAVDPSSLGTGFVAAAHADWGLLLDDGTGVPGDPLLRESREPRVGTSPTTGAALAPPDASSPTANPVNGHEHGLGDALQYSCIYRLPQPLDCGSVAACECNGPGSVDTNPVCQASDGSYATVQRAAHAQPPVRLLELAHELGAEAVLGSICADTGVPNGQPGFAYTPTASAITRALRQKLVPPP
ncbi:MAG: hypothetical protein HY908_06740 [Myxococcales bacterium]|nr:hypothetical protein [Myxococcales bacterium]